MTYNPEQSETEEASGAYVVEPLHWLIRFLYGSVKKHLVLLGVLIQRHRRCRLTVTESAPFGQPSRNPDTSIHAFKHSSLQMWHNSFSKIASGFNLVISRGILLECSSQQIRLHAIRFEQYVQRYDYYFFYWLSTLSQMYAVTLWKFQRMPTAGWVGPDLPIIPRRQ